MANKGFSVSVSAILREGVDFGYRRNIFGIPGHSDDGGKMNSTTGRVNYENPCLPTLEQGFRFSVR